MSTTTINTTGMSFPIDVKGCSSQVQELYPLDFDYQQRVQKLWADTADSPGPRELRRRNYRYLVSLYYDMPKRAEADDKPMSPEFKDLIFFCRYVGPRPTAKLSLHRQHNDIGYQISNLEWTDKRKQAEVRRGAQHHLYLDRRLTDRALADLLTTKVGKKITAPAIKKARQRLTTKGIAPNEITRLLFEKHGLPYATSTDPVEAWD